VRICGNAFVLHTTSIAEPGPDLYPQKNVVNAALDAQIHIYHFEPFEKLRVNSARNLSPENIFHPPFDAQQIPML
jgi:hypothetical protein